MLPPKLLRNPRDSEPNEEDLRCLTKRSESDSKTLRHFESGIPLHYFSAVLGVWRDPSRLEAGKDCPNFQEGKEERPW